MTCSLYNGHLTHVTCLCQWCCISACQIGTFKLRAKVWTHQLFLNDQLKEEIMSRIFDCYFYHSHRVFKPQNDFLWGSWYVYSDCDPATAVGAVAKARLAGLTAHDIVVHAKIHGMILLALRSRLFQPSQPNFFCHFLTMISWAQGHLPHVTDKITTHHSQRWFFTSSWFDHKTIFISPLATPCLHWLAVG